MSTRRIVALFLLALMAVGYAIAAIAAATTGLYSAATGGWVLTGPAGFVATAGPALLAVVLFVAIARNAPARVIILLFGAWFVLGLGSALVIHPWWGSGLLINAAIPLILVWPELRRQPDAV